MARKPTINSDSVAQDQIRAFVERIMRMREEAKAINDDIREIYAEAKGNGFDKTVLGKLVLYVEKRAKDESAVMEREALFDLYLEAFDARASHAHAREDESNTATHAAASEGSATPPASPLANHIPDVGKMVDDNSHADVPVVGTATSLAGAEGDEDRQPNSEVALTPVKAGQARQAGEGDGDIRTPSPAPNSQTREGESGAMPVMAGEPAGEAIGHTPASPVVAFPPGSIRHEHTPPVGIIRHEAQKCFPELWGPALGDLKDDIRANGIREPIVMQGNILLDGWSRYMAARDLHIAYPVKEYDGTDAFADIIKLNMAARNLNLAERISIARKLIKLAPEREAEIGELLDLEQAREAAE